MMYLLHYFIITCNLAMNIPVHMYFHFEIRIPQSEIAKVKR